MVGRQDSEAKGIFSSIDWFTIVLYVALLVMGWMSVCGASYDFDKEGFDLLSFSTNSGKQIVWIGTSFVLGMLVLSIDERVYESLSPFIYALFMVLLLATPFLAHDIKGSKSWIKFGSFSIQPAEFAKMGVALFLARFISSYNLKLQRVKDLAMCIGVVFLPIILIILQKETGSALVYFAFFLMFYREGMPGSILFVGVAAVYYFVVGLRYANEPFLGIEGSSLGTSLVLLSIIVFVGSMMWVYTTKRQPIYRAIGGGLAICIAAILVAKHVKAVNITLIMLFVCICVIAYLFYLALRERMYQYALIGVFAIGSIGFFYSANFVLNNVMQPHQQKRINVLLGLEDDPRGAGYNVKQAEIAIGSGGLTGKGFMKGTQTKLKYVPEQDTDFIYCTVGEERGFVGSAGVLILFLLLIWRLIYLSERQIYSFGRIYGYCVLSIFLFHLFINVGMVLGLTPVIGIPLPFFSYGGSSLWGFTILLFIFLRIDAARNRMGRQY